MTLKIKESEICNYTNFSDTVLSRLKRQERENEHKRYTLLKKASLLEKYNITDEDLIFIIETKNRFIED